MEHVVAPLSVQYCHYCTVLDSDGFSESSAVVTVNGQVHAPPVIITFVIHRLINLDSQLHYVSAYAHICSRTASCIVRVVVVVNFALIATGLHHNG